MVVEGSDDSESVGRQEQASDDRILPFRRRPQSKAPARLSATTLGDAVDKIDLLAFARDAIDTSVRESDIDPDAARDRLAIKSERVFARRFWFKVGKPVRVKILKFKTAKGVTDWEITLLWWMDALDTSGPEVQTAPSRFNYVRGHVLLVIFSLLLLITFGATIFHPPPTSQALVMRFAVQAGLLVAWCLALVLDVRPYTICKRLDREEEQARAEPSI